MRLSSPIKAFAAGLLLAAIVPSASAAFKVVGYFPSWQGTVSSIQFSKLTHINYAFVLPNANGSLQAVENPAKLDSLVTAAHNAGVKVSIAVGGWNDGDDSAFEALAASSTARTAFVNNLVNFVNQHNLDGVDIDWEYPDSSAEANNYTTLMSQLATAMHSRGKLLTAAVIAQGSTANFIQSGVFNSVDWLNIMNYDNNNFQHSTFSAAVACYDYWGGRGLPASKTVMGLPFYSRPGYFSYAQLLSQGASPTSDTFNGEGYNGITTVSNKTHLAFDRNGGGIMMWEISQDATGANSLVSAIDRVVDQRQGGPDFSLSATPTSQSVPRGSGTTYTVAVSALNGFSGTVTFSVSGLPAGATASFSPTSVGGSGNSTLSVSTTTSTPSGSFTLTITGASGSLTHTDTVTLNVSDFTVSATPSARTVTAGSSTTYAVDVGTVNGFSSSVNLSVSGLPTGATASFSPASVSPPGSSTLTVTTTGSTATGLATLTITGASGNLSRSTNVSLNVIANTLPAGWIAEDVGAVGIPGSASFSSGTFTVRGSGSDIWSTSDQFHIVRRSVSGDVTVIARVVSETQTHAYAKAGVMIRESTEVGAKNVAVLLTPTNGVSLQVRPALNASTINVAGWIRGLTPPRWVRLMRSGNTFSAAHSADGVTWTTFATTNVTLTTLTFAGLAVTSHNNAALNTATFDNVSVAGPTPDFSISASPGSRTVTVGNSTTYTVNVGAINGFSGTVNLSASGEPGGSTVSFNPPSITGSGTSTMTVVTDPNTPVGTSSIVITGTSGALTHSTSVSLVTDPSPAPDFSIAVNPGSQTVTAGNSTTYTVTITATNGFNGTVDLSASDLPAGASASFNPASVTGSGSSTLTISTATNTQPGGHTFTLTGTSGALTRAKAVGLIVNSVPSGVFEAESMGFTVSGATTTLQTDAAASGGQWISLNADGVNDYIEFTTPNVSAGTYNVVLLYKQHPNRGRLSLTVDGVKLDGDLDQYSATPSYVTKDFGPITFSSFGTHKIRLTVVGKNASSPAFTLSADAIRLIAPTTLWTSQNIGAVGLAGSFSQNGNTFTVAGSGSDIWTTADQFRFAYRAVSGPQTITARVVSETQTHAFAKAGVMMRASLATNSVHASVLLTPTNGVSLHIRPSTGAASINVSGWVKGPVPPYWVRLARTGNTFIASASADGVLWTQIGSTNVTMPSATVSGMAVTSHNNAALNTATFDNVTLP